MTKLGQRWERCPKAWLRDEGQEAMGMLADHTTFESTRILPRAGGMHDQDPKFVEALPLMREERELVRAALAKLEREG